MPKLKSKQALQETLKKLESDLDKLRNTKLPGGQPPENLPLLESRIANIRQQLVAKLSTTESCVAVPVIRDGNKRKWTGAGQRSDRHGSKPPPGIKH